MPARGWATAKSRSRAMAPGSGTASGLPTRTYVLSGEAAAMPRFTLAAKPSGAAFSSTRVPGGSAPVEPGMLATTISSSTCGASAGSVSSS